MPAQVSRWLRVLSLALAAALAAVATAGCDDDEDESQQAQKERRAAGESDDNGQDEQSEKEPVEPLPQKVTDIDWDKAKLGRQLYFDARLSADESVACASCHQLEHFGAEPRDVSVGIGEQKGPINSPTVLNARYNIAQFWDGRAEDLQEQAEKPVTNPIEMGAKAWDEVVERVEKVEGYQKSFGALYDGDISKKSITHAIAEYERTLVTPSPFDAYVRGDEAAISDQAKKGYETFKQVGCPTCHRGINIGGGMFQKMGLLEDYFGQLDRDLTEADLGRYNVTKKDEDKHVFKVPTLRNVAKTAPWLHDGSQDDLGEVVRIMGRHQLDKKLSDEQVGQIVAFLESLTGEIPDYAWPEGKPPSADSEDEGAVAEKEAPQGDTKPAGH